MSDDQARARFAAARVARLATVSAQGQPHLVPVTFAVVDEHIVTAVDHKPKTTTALRRLRNIAENPSVTLLVDEYAEDWSELWWVRADGLGEVVSAQDHPARVETLVAKYAQYERHRLAATLIVVRVLRWSGWMAVAAPG